MKALSFCALLALALCAPVLSASVIPVAGNGSDTQVNETGTSWNGSGEFRVGVGSSVGSVAVLVFELPVLPEGETVDSADMAFSIVGGNNWHALYQKSLDLYGVRMSGSRAVLASDYYKGAYNGDPAAQAIQESIVYETEDLNQGAPGVMGRVDTSAVAEATLGGWLQSLYDSPVYNPTGTNYAFLRLSPREDFTSTYRYWIVASADNSTVENRPVLTLSTIPEPATLALLVLGGLGLIRRNRR